MYDDLARSQQPSPLEWFVVNAVIPTVLASFALQTIGASRTPAKPAVYPAIVMLRVIQEPCIGGPLPDTFPLLVRIPHARYPADMARSGVRGYVRLKALVTIYGRVSRSSVLILHATDSRFVPAALKAIAGAVFRPATLDNARIAYGVTMTIAFTPPKNEARR